jgi:hypothetical protein
MFAWLAAFVGGLELWFVGGLELWFVGGLELWTAALGLGAP